MGQSSVVSGLGEEKAHAKAQSRQEIVFALRLGAFARDSLPSVLIRVHPWRLLLWFVASVFRLVFVCFVCFVVLPPFHRVSASPRLPSSLFLPSHYEAGHWEKIAE